MNFSTFIFKYSISVDRILIFINASLLKRRRIPVPSKVKAYFNHVIRTPQVDIWGDRLCRKKSNT